MSVHHAVLQLSVTTTPGHLNFSEIRRWQHQEALDLHTSPLILAVSPAQQMAILNDEHHQAVLLVNQALATAVGEPSQVRSLIWHATIGAEIQWPYQSINGRI